MQFRKSTFDIRKPHLGGRQAVAILFKSRCQLPQPNCQRTTKTTHGRSRWSFRCPMDRGRTRDGRQPAVTCVFELGLWPLCCGSSFRPEHHMILIMRSRSRGQFSQEIHILEKTATKRMAAGKREETAPEILHPRRAADPNSTPVGTLRKGPFKKYSNRDKTRLLIASLSTTFSAIYSA